MSYDVTIIGGGLSGLSLAYYLNLQKKKVRVIEERPRYENDKLWSFWLDESDNFLLRSIVHHCWNRWDIIDEHGNCIPSSYPRLSYCCLQSGDFYTFIQENTSVDFIMNERVHSLDEYSGENTLLVDARTDRSTTPAYFQQVHGWIIESKKAVFDTKSATLMDFSQKQHPQQGVFFFYILPFSSHHALIEPTLFSNTQQSEDFFYQNLLSYLHKKSIDTYRILNHEIGLIPMTVLPQKLSVDYYTIGTRGGWVRPSTGYSLRQSLIMARNLADFIAKNNKLPSRILPAYSPTSRWLDTVFLRVLQRHPEHAPELFSTLFQQMPSNKMVQFMQDYNVLRKTLRIIASVPHKFLFLRNIFPLNTP